MKASERPSKEVVTTLHISKHGAHLLGRRALQQDLKGRVAHLSTCKQAPFRIVWHAPSRKQPGFHEMGIEFEELSDFWGASFETQDTLAITQSPEPKESPAVAGEPATAKVDESTCGTILDQLRRIPSNPEGREITDAIWCGLVEQLEERRVITRGELIASLRKVGLQL
jgi:hypothetical protein